MGTALLLNLAATGQAADAHIQLTALPATMRATPTGPLAGTSAVEIAGARGETESFQVVVTAVDGKLDGVTASLEPLRQTGGPSLPETSLELFRVAWVPVRHSSPRATVAPGLIADALIPFKNPYTGEPVREPHWSDAKPDGSRFGATGFALWPEHHQALWVDVRIPRDATPGVYESALRVTAKNASAVKIPVRLTVWNFTLPEGPTHENHFGDFGRLRTYHHLERDPEKYARLEERYIAMLAAHRLNPPLPAWLWPEPAADGTVVFDTAADQKFSEFVARYHVTDFPVPRAPFRDVLGEHRSQAINFYRTVFAYLEKHGWAKRAYLYMLDEPNDPEAYERFEKVVLVHGVRTTSELAYTDFIENELPNHEFLGELTRGKLIYYPTVTREPFRNEGRVTDLIESGKLFADIGLPPLDPAVDRAMICGSPAMNRDMCDLLDSRGFKVSPYIGAQGDYVIERAFVEK